MDLLRIQRYVHNSDGLESGEIEWKVTRYTIAIYTFYINSLISRMSVDGSCSGDEAYDYYRIVRLDGNDRVIGTYDFSLLDVVSLSFLFTDYSLSSMFLKTNDVLESLFDEDTPHTLLFNPVPMDYNGEPKPDRWHLLYLDIDDLRVSSSELMEGLSFRRDDIQGYLRPRTVSPLWKRICEKYRGDEELLRFIYYDTLWYHTGRGIHFVAYGNWGKTTSKLDMIHAMMMGVDLDQSQDERIQSLRARLRSDPDQLVGERMKIRLAGSINPKSGDIALGFAHPFALPFYQPFSDDSYAMSMNHAMGRFGIATMDHERPEIIGHPEDIETPQTPIVNINLDEDIYNDYDPFEDMYAPATKKDEPKEEPQKEAQTTINAPVKKEEPICDEEAYDPFEDLYAPANKKEDKEPKEGSGTPGPNTQLNKEEPKDIYDDYDPFEDLYAPVTKNEEPKQDRPVNMRYLGESFYGKVVKWGRNHKRVIDDDDKRSVAAFIVNRGLNIDEIMQELIKNETVDLNKYARIAKKAQEENKPETINTRIATVWRWEIQFPADVVAKRIAKSLGLESQLKIDEEGRAILSDVYTSDTPHWLKGKRLKYSRDFKAFRFKIVREDLIIDRVNELKPIESAQLERALGIAETVELEWGVLKHIRSSNRIADLHAYVWLNNLKRRNYTDGIVPKEEAVHYIMNQTGLSESTIKHRLRRLEKSGWILSVSRGYIIHSWAHIANLLKIHCERVVLVSKEELKDLKSFKSVIASVPGTFKEPVIKYEIAKSLGISTHTVKRNRRGRLREWYRVRYVNTYESREQAEQAQTQELHPIHGWPLCLCGYKMYPTKLDKGTWVLERSSAARILDLAITCRSGKSKRLRKATAHLANTGGGVRAKTYQPMEDSKRFTNFTPDIQMPSQPTDVPKTWKLPVHSLGEINTHNDGFNGGCYWGVVS